MTAAQIPAYQNLLIRLGRSRFFCAALLLHLVMIIGLGSVVLFDAKKEVPEMMAEGGSFITESTTIETPPETAPSAPSQLAPSLPKMEPPSMSAITTTSNVASSFGLPVQATATFSTARTFTSQTGPVAKTSQPLGSAGGEGASHSFFGDSKATPSGLAGTFYDFKQDKRGKSSDMNGAIYAKTVTDFVTGGWNTSAFSKFFRGPKQIYTEQILVPEIDSEEGPKAFGMGGKVEPRLWLVHYKAKVTPPEGGTYHFVGAGDDVLFVRFNNKLVLERCWNFHTDWKPVDNYRYGFTGMPDGFAKGDAISVQAGQSYPIEILIGEQPGGKFFASLLIEKEGVTYKKHSSGAPILPAFRIVGNTPQPPLAAGQKQPPHEEDGPVWKAVAPGLGSGLGFAQ